MKATFSKDKMEVTLSNEAVKAIRFVKGYNTDLRVSLKGIREDILFDWVDNNLIGICSEAALSGCKSEDIHRYCKMIEHIVDQIVR